MWSFLPREKKQVDGGKGLHELSVKDEKHVVEYCF